MSTPEAKPLISPAIFFAPSRFLSNTPTIAPYSAKRRQIAPPIAPAPPVTMTFLPFSPRMASSQRRVRVELGLALLEMRGEAFLHLGPHEAQHLERRRGVEGRAHHAQPVVERVFGEADRGLGAFGELGRHFETLGLELVVLDA